MDLSTLPSEAADPALYANRYHELIAGATTLLVLPTLAVILRLLSRWISGSGLWVRGCAIGSEKDMFSYGCSLTIMP